MSLRSLMHDMADDAPLKAMPAGLFDRARRRRRWRWTAAASAALVLFLAGYAGFDATRQHTAPGGGVPGAEGLPSKIFDPPAWIALHREDPVGPASLVFVGHSLPEERFSTAGGIGSVIVGLRSDTYRIAYPDEAPVLSPDGRTLLMPDLTGTSFTTPHHRVLALDLASGKVVREAIGHRPLQWASGGSRVVLGTAYRWDDRPAINDFIVTVASWPSLEREWAVHIERPNAFEGESSLNLALSPKTDRLVITTCGELRVYRSDGSIALRRASGWDQVAGRVAWRDDGRIALFSRTTPEANRPYNPGVWRLGFVDESTGAAVAGPTYPSIEGAHGVEVIAWRGDDAYAIVRTWKPGQLESMTVTLVRLRPGATKPETVVEAPVGISMLDVATDYVDVTRATGEPDFGVNWRYVLSIALTVGSGIVVAVPLTIGLVALWRNQRRRGEREFGNGRTLAR